MLVLLSFPSFSSPVLVPCSRQPKKMGRESRRGEGQGVDPGFLLPACQTQRGWHAKIWSIQTVGFVVPCAVFSTNPPHFITDLWCHFSWLHCNQETLVLTCLWNQERPLWRRKGVLLEQECLRERSLFCRRVHRLCDTWTYHINWQAATPTACLRRNRSK